MRLLSLVLAGMLALGGCSSFFVGNKSVENVRVMVSDNGADNDVRKCKAAVNLLKAQKSRISNVTGWIIKAIRDEYEMNSYGGAIVQSGNTSGVLLKADSHEELRLIEQLYLAQVPRSDSVA